MLCPVQFNKCTLPTAAILCMPVLAESDCTRKHYKQFNAMAIQYKHSIDRVFDSK